LPTSGLPRFVAGVAAGVRALGVVDADSAGANDTDVAGGGAADGPGGASGRGSASADADPRPVVAAAGAEAGDRSATAPAPVSTTAVRPAAIHRHERRAVGRVGAPSVCEVSEDVAAAVSASGWAVGAKASASEDREPVVTTSVGVGAGPVLATSSAAASDADNSAADVNRSESCGLSARASHASNAGVTPGAPGATCVGTGR
jgi:hypothetical protein